MSAVFEVLEEAWHGPDPGRGQAPETAVSSALSDLRPGAAARLTNEQMRKLLDSIEAADGRTFESVVAKVMEFSPGFMVPVKP